MKAKLLAENQQFVSQLSENVVYLMGLSFIVGSLFTIFILLVFDYMRRNGAEKSKKR